MHRKAVCDEVSYHVLHTLEMVIHGVIGNEAGNVERAREAARFGHALDQTVDAFQHDAKGLEASRLALQRL